MKRIYLDNSATTKLDEKVIEAMNKTFSIFGNPSSVHKFGRESRLVIHKARETIAKFINCDFQEVIFASGGSESDNLAIKGIVDAWHSRYKIQDTGYKQITNSKSQITNKPQNTKYKILNTEVVMPHIITSMIEHHAVLHTIQCLEKEGKIEVTYIKPGKNGIIKVTDVRKAIKPNTILVSIMYVNNETGCVQPIREIGKLIEKINLPSRMSKVESRKRGSKLATFNFELSTGNEIKSKIFFHTDAVQAPEYLPMNVSQLGVDLLTLTAHKIHGPKGVGALFIKAGTPILPQITGGEHEFRLRAGTENITGIVGFAEAIRQVIGHQSSVVSQVERLRDKLENFILKNIPNTYLNGDKVNRAPHITNISFKNAEGEAIILNLDHFGIAVSSGSACTSHKLESSHVLSSMNVSEELAHGAIRFSLSRETTEAEIDKVCKVLPVIIEKLRQMSPFR